MKFQGVGGVNTVEASNMKSQEFVGGIKFSRKLKHELQNT